MNQQTHKHETALTFTRLAIALANDYESVYVINTDNDSYVEYITDSATMELIERSAGKDFYADTRKNCRILVHPEDQEHSTTAAEKIKVDFMNNALAERADRMFHRILQQETIYEKQCLRIVTIF